MNIRVFFLSVFSFLFLTVSTAFAQQSPGEFVISLMKEANGLSELSKDTREQALLNLIRRGFDVQLIGKFVLGRYWRTATVEQKAEFLDVFEMATVRSFSPLLGDVPLDSFKIVRIKWADSNNLNDVSVFSTIDSGNATPIKIHWRLRKYGYDDYKILDINAEGISLIVTMRSEYTSFISRNSIDGLIVELRKKADERR